MYGEKNLGSLSRTNDKEQHQMRTLALLTTFTLAAAFCFVLLHTAHAGRSTGSAASSTAFTPAYMLKDIRQSETSAQSSMASGFLTIDDTIYFRAEMGASAGAIMKSDSTAEGTHILKSNWLHFWGGAPGGFIDFNGTLMFAFNDGSTGLELWKSDGTVTGTNPFSALTNISGFPWNSSVLSDTLFFVGEAPPYGFELWQSDGTVTGTMMVKDIYPGSGSGFPHGVTDFEGMVFFSARHMLAGAELWQSDGTVTGTVMVKDIHLTTFELFLPFVSRP